MLTIFFALRLAERKLRNDMLIGLGRPGRIRGSLVGKQEDGAKRMWENKIG